MSDDPTRTLKKTCPSCEGTLKVSPKLFGKKFKCSKCGSVLLFSKATGELTLETEEAEVATRQGPAVKVAAIITLAIGSVVLLIVLGFGVSAVLSARRASQRIACSNNMKAIGLAFQKYHEANGHWPPAYTVDGQGEPLHSWRALILPFMDQQALFEQIDFSKPWDDPVNRAAANTVVPVYQCEATSIEPTQTTYVAVVDPKGIMTGSEPTRKRDVEYFRGGDGLSNTIMIVEADADNAVHWMSAEDIDMETHIRRAPTAHNAGSYALFADGAVLFIPSSISPVLQEALITKQGDEVIGHEFELMMESSHQ